MTVVVQQRLLDADAAEERAEELLDRHKVECEYIGSILCKAITELEAVADEKHVLGSPFGGHDVKGAIDAISALLPPVYHREPGELIALSALAHQAALREME